MRRWIAVSLLFALAVPACGRRSVDEAAASARFRVAWEKRRSGDEAGYQAVMQEIATRWPSSRAGRRALEAKSASGGQGAFVGAAVGVISAIAVPAFMKYRARESGELPPDLVDSPQARTLRGPSGARVRTTPVKDR